MSGIKRHSDAPANPMPDRDNPGMRRMIGCMVLIAMNVLAGCGTGTDDARNSEIYRQGNGFYKNGQYAEASRTYERIVQQGFRNGYVYYNLGNAYFKQQQFGRAILAYERARRLMPRDQDVRANLEIANLRIVDQLKVPEPWIGQVMLRSITVNEATVATSIAGGLLALLAVIYILSDRFDIRRLAYHVGIVIAVVFLICSAVTASRIYDQTGRAEAIILSTESDVRSGPGTTYDQLFILHEGTKVTVVEERGTWKRIELPDGKSGWIGQIALEVI